MVENYIQIDQSVTVTVGLASYNRPQLLKRAISSIKAQSYKNLEILISDNGSENPAIEGMIKKFASEDSRVKYTLHKVNQGAFFNFRFLINQANGKYFIWLADDDYWCNSYVEELLAQHISSGAGLTYGRAEVVDVDLPEKDLVAKEMKTERRRFLALMNFLRFDSDSVIYGIFNTVNGQRLAGLLRDWTLPESWCFKYPFLLFNFVSYCFLYGLIASGGFCNASSSRSTHYIGGRSDPKVYPSFGKKHVNLVAAYVWTHIQMGQRFVVASLLAGSCQGLLLAPFAAIWFFVRRIAVALSLRFKSQRDTNEN